MERAEITMNGFDFVIEYDDSLPDPSIYDEYILSYNGRELAYEYYEVVDMINHMINVSSRG